MKKHLVVYFIAVFVIMFSACTSELRENLNELSSNSSLNAEKMKNQFLSEVTKELEKAEVVLIEIENEAKKTSEELNEETRKSLEELKKERAKLEIQIGALKNVSRENWEITRNSFTESMDDFKIEFESFLEGLKIR